MFIHEVCNALDQAQIPYAIVGGYAVALHGVVRGTVDIDIIIEWTLNNLQSIEKVLKSLELVSLIPINSKNLFHFREEYIQERNLTAWNFYDPKNPTKQIDILINYDLKQSTQTKKIKTPKGSIRILSIKDLIDMKKKSGRPQDLEDVKALESL